MKIAIKLVIPKKQDGLKKWTRRPPRHGPTLGCAMEVTSTSSFPNDIFDMDYWTGVFEAFF
jgi:hypothetical protein